MEISISSRNNKYENTDPYQTIVNDIRIAIKSPFQQSTIHHHCNDASQIVVPFHMSSHIIKPIILILNEY